MNVTIVLVCNEDVLNQRLNRCDQCVKNAPLKHPRFRCAQTRTSGTFRFEIETGEVH